MVLFIRYKNGLRWKKLALSRPKITLRLLSQELASNQVNIQLLGAGLHNQIFKKYTDNNDPDTVKLSQDHLHQHQIDFEHAASKDPIIDFKLPALQGANIEEHFYKIGYQQADPYLKRAHKLANITLPPKPKHWQQTSGWTRYNKDGSFEKVEAPLEDTMVFDVEVLMSEGKYPTIAVAATAEAWYSWTSPFVNGEDKSSEYLVPFGSSQKEESPRIIVGHNVGYDRARIADEYNVKGTNIRYIDTMSLHIAVSGICSQQRPMWSKENKRRIEQQQQQDESQLMAEHLGLADNSKGEAPVDFYDVSTLNSLRDVANFYCAENIDKSQRSYFEKGTLDDVKDHFQSLMSYCAKDVELTHMVYKKVFPQFREYCPHPASFLGMLEIGSAFLTVTEKWEKYLKQATEAHNILEEKLELKLVELADEAMKLTGNDEEIMKDPWLSQLDWTVNPRQRKLKGAPAWYKDIYNTKEQRPKVTLRSRISPILLRTRWKEYPLHFVKDNGWCFEIPESDLINHKPSLVIRNEGRFFVKVPHKDGEDANCGNPFAKGYLKAFDGGILNSDYKEAEDALKLNSQSAYWISARERILSQFVVWDTDKKINLNLPPRDGKNGIILPQMIAMGTITRRAVERTWLTASNAKLNRIGSELKSMITAPEGYKIVGADVDSEELWISSLIGDAQFGFHGATALGWMTLQGTKAHGTDLHSKTAKIVGISRDTAKIFNYARIYGAGVKYATSLLMQHSPGMDLKQAKELGAHLYKETKGTKCFEKGGWYSSPFWTGGSESFMFNSLEHIANSDKPKTPVLGCTITKALQPRYTKTQFLTSRVNWVVQSSGVDYLHLLIVSMSHLIEKYKIDARFMISVHDEVRYMSTKEDEHRTALALQVANLWTRSLFCQRLGIESLPQNVAFFSAVDFDTVLRKDPSMDCQTPSHTDPIEKGHTLTIYELLEEMTKSNPNPSECLLGEPSGENKIVEIDPSETKEFLQANKANDQKQPYNILVNQYMSPKMQRNMGGKSTTSVVSKVDEDKGFEDEVGQEGDLDEFMNDFNTSRSVTMMKEFTVSRRKREIPSSKREMRYGNSQTTTRVTPKDSYVNI